MTPSARVNNNGTTNASSTRACPVCETKARRDARYFPTIRYNDFDGVLILLNQNWPGEICWYGSARRTLPKVDRGITRNCDRIRDYSAIKVDVGITVKG